MKFGVTFAKIFGRENSELFLQQETKLTEKVYYSLSSSKK